MLGRLIRSLSAIMEGSSFIQAAPSIDSIQAWQAVTEECVSSDKRHLLKDKFSHSVTLLTAEVPREKVAVVSKLVRPLLVDIRGKLFVEHPRDETKKVLLFDPIKVQSIDEWLSEAARKSAEEEGVVLPPSTTYNLDVTYDMYSLEDALKVVLPPGVQVSGYTVIGHIAHLNLTPEVLPFKFVIGQLILDKNRRLRTVVNKLHVIDNTFRNFQMELVAGKEDYLTELKENGCKFKMDFSKVYWNSRLSTEHDRIVQQLASDDVLYDLFAGIGPFAIPAARKGCTVLANDLNPDSVRWLRQNVVENASKRRRLDVDCHNLDARTFVRDVVRTDYRRRMVDGDTTGRVFVVMNLPALAVQFLDVLRELVDAPFVEEQLQGEWGRLKSLHVRCYCFLRDEVDGKDRLDEWTLSNVEKTALNFVGLTAFDAFNARFVRNVAVSKNMFCLEFTLSTSNLAELCGRGGGDGEYPASKRLKLNVGGE